MVMVPRVQRLSVKLDHQVWDSVRKYRLPNVELASRALQDVIGIQPGTKMIGRLPVKLWELPEPPQATPAELSARARKVMYDLQLIQAAQAQSAAKARNEADFGDDDSDEGTESGSNESEGTDDSQDFAELLWYPESGCEMSDGTDDNAVYEGIEEFEAKSGEGDSTVSKHLEIPSKAQRLDSKAKCGEWLNNNTEHTIKPTDYKRKREDSPPPRPQQRSSTAKKPKIVIDLTDSPDTTQVQHSSTRIQRGAPDRTSLRPSAAHVPASPPSRHLTPPGRLAKYRKAPAYWTTTLSMNLIKWLEQAETNSGQTRLSGLELQIGINKPGGNTTLLGFDAPDYDKIKLTRIQLPPWAQPNYGPWKLLDWFVLEVRYKSGTHRYADSEVHHPSNHSMFEFGPPYWILAFPAEAVTRSEVKTQQLNEAPLPHGRQMSGKEKAMKKKPQTNVQTLTMMLGTKGMVPLMHGRHIEKKFADEFVAACAEGKGVLVLETSERFSLQVV